MNKEDFEYIYTKYFARLCRFAKVFVKDNDQAKEIVQQVFFKIWDKKNVLQLENPYSYLTQSTKNEALQHIKRTKIHVALESGEAGEHAEELVNPGIDSFTFDLIQRSIDHLPEKCKEIIIMKVNDGLTHKEIAAYLNISEKTIEGQVSIAFKKIRMVLAKANLRTN